MIPPDSMQTIKKQAERSMRVCLGCLLALMLTGCTPPGPRALLEGKKLIEHGKYKEAIEAFLAAAKVSPDDLASLIFTSGTTGTPKGVMLSHRNFASLVAKLCTVFDLGPGDGMLSVLPLHHTFEFSCGLLVPLSRGAEVEYLDELTADRIGDALGSGRITAMIGVPALWSLLHRRITQELAAKPGLVQQAFEALQRGNAALRDSALGWNLGKAHFWPVHRRFGGRLRILTWPIHGSYLYYLAQGQHEYYVPVKPDHSEGYSGLAPSHTWPANVHEVPAALVRYQEFDLVIFQSPKNYLEDQFEILSEQQRQLPRIYIEHEPPLEHPTGTRHLVDDPHTLLVHVTPFNALMWDSGRTPTRVIDHGVVVPEALKYNGELPRGLAIVNNLSQGGRRLGLDLFERARAQVSLDLVGIDSEQLGGLGSLTHRELLELEVRYRFVFSPIRYTSLELGREGRQRRST